MGSFVHILLLHVAIYVAMSQVRCGGDLNVRHGLLFQHLLNADTEFVSLDIKYIYS